MYIYKPPTFTNLDHAKIYLKQHNYVAINVISKIKAKQYLSQLESYIITNNLDQGQLHDKHIGHSIFMKNIRKEPKVIESFQKIWNCEKLQESYDGACYMIPTIEKKDLWPHVDMNTIYFNNICYQGFVNLTNNTNGGFVIWNTTINESIKYLKKYPNNSNFTLVPIPKNITPTNIIVPPGTLVIWDSRMIHCNIPPTKQSRAVLYVCMVPKNIISKTAIAKLNLYKKNKYTTKHNPFEPELFD